MRVRVWDAVESEFAWVNDCLVLAKICVARANTRGLNVMQEANCVKGRLAKVYEQNVNMFIIKIWEWWNSVRQIGTKNIVPRSNDSSCVSKECDNFDEDAWHTNYVLWWLSGCKQKMVFFAMTWCNDGIRDENFLHHEVWWCALGVKWVYENSRKTFNDRLDSKICIAKWMSETRVRNGKHLWAKICSKCE